MQIVVSGKHLEMGDSLTDYVRSEMKSKIEQYFKEAVYAHVTISKRTHFFHVDITVQEGIGKGTIIRGESDDTDPYHSVDVAIAKVAKQLRRHKDKLHDIYKRYREGMDAVKRVFVAPHTEEGTDEEYEDGGNPAIISEHPMKVERLSVSRAVERMDMLGAPSLLFINAVSGAVNMLYYRKDGNIAWVETTLKP
ncbi:MAG: ribosome-associated translation inhibitor RaiA [Proteobacteria bacterium]|nr:ribosome-associated translation inhibitor RaiA [Pseudomonadota bacterium]